MRTKDPSILARVQTDDRDEMVNTAMYFYFWVPYNSGGGDFLTS